MKKIPSIALTTMALLLGACSSSSTEDPSGTPSSASGNESDTVSEAVDSEGEDATDDEAPTASGEDVVLDVTEAFLGDGQRIWYHISLTEPEKYRAMSAILVEDGQATAFSVLDHTAPVLAETSDYRSESYPDDLLPLADIANLSDEAALELIQERHNQYPDSMSAVNLPDGTGLWTGGYCAFDMGDFPEPEATQLKISFTDPMDSGGVFQTLGGLSWPLQQTRELGFDAFAPGMESFLNVCGESEQVLRELNVDTGNLDPIQTAPAVEVSWINEEDGYQIGLDEGLRSFEIDGVLFGGYMVTVFDGTDEFALVTKLEQPSVFVLDTAPISNE